MTFSQSERSCVQAQSACRVLQLLCLSGSLREEETDLGFLDFSGTKRHPRGTKQKATAQNENAPDLTGRGHSQNMEHETRFELATLTLASNSGNLANTQFYSDSFNSWSGRTRRGCALRGKERQLDLWQ